MVFLINPFPNNILNSFKLKQFVDGNFEFDGNGAELDIMAENTVRKGEIARYQQLLLFPQCFQKTCPTDT